MKIRSGFVSNSSSSSFIIASREPLEVTDEMVEKIFKVQIDTPMFSLSKKILQLFEKESDVMEFDEWVTNNYGELKDEEYKEEVMQYKSVATFKSLTDKGFIVRVGDFYNDSGDSLEQFLTDDFKIDYGDDDLYIQKLE